MKRHFICCFATRWTPNKIYYSFCVVCLNGLSWLRYSNRAYFSFPLCGRGRVNSAWWEWLWSPTKCFATCICSFFIFFVSLFFCFLQCANHNKRFLLPDQPIKAFRLGNSRLVYERKTIDCGPTNTNPSSDQLKCKGLYSYFPLIIIARECEERENISCTNILNQYDKKFILRCMLTKTIFVCVPSCCRLQQSQKVETWGLTKG